MTQQERSNGKSAIFDPFRVYVKVKVNEIHLEEYLRIIPPFIENLKHSEPDTMQFEAFCNREDREVAWLQSYKTANGFDAHMENPELQDMQRKMTSFQDSIQDLYTMDKPTESTLVNLKNLELAPVVLKPWPGTIRLTESKDSNSKIQSIVVFELTDMDVYRTISEQVEHAAERQTGVAFHRSYQVDDSTILAFEEYANEKVVLDWVKVFAANSGDFGSLIKSMTYNVFGSPTGECKKTLDSWGAKYYEKISGFTRYQ